MSLRAVGFVEDWLLGNAQIRASLGDGRIEESKRYAVHLLIAANANGIPLEEIANEFPDLVGVIAANLAGLPLTLGEHWKVEARQPCRVDRPR